jgi:hypothetical protein
MLKDARYEKPKVFVNLFVFTDAVHVLDGSSAYHQENTTVHTASGIVSQYCF